MTQGGSQEAFQEVDLLQVRQFLAGDLRLLASLHECELEPGELDELAACPIAERFSLQFEADRLEQSNKLINTGLERVAKVGPGVAADEQAVDYADIYLTHRCRAAPSESVWLDEDGLERQQPMFEVRTWYENFGVKAPDWRQKADDHIALQLEFVALLLEQDEDGAEPVMQAARFLDDHLLVWIDLFARRVAERCSTPFYAGVAMLTASYLDAARGLMEELTGYERPAPDKRRKAAGPIALEVEQAPDAQPYAPGAAPSW